MAGVTLEGVSKVYGEDVVAIRDVDLTVRDGEFVVFVGPSGCGKTTVLRVIAGLEDATRGRVFIGEDLVNGLPPRERDVAMVFQGYALYPHMNVRENMSFALKLRKLDGAEISRRVEEAAKTLGIERLLERKPKALSGGQRQRVALGRAIVREPKAFLMDEPLSNLDAGLRVLMRAEIVRLHDRIGATTIEVEPRVVESVGSEKYVHFGAPGEPFAKGARASEGLGGTMVARVSPGSTARWGEAMLLAVDASRVRLFDPDTGEAIF